MKRENIVKVMECYPEPFYAKWYDYKAKKVDNHFEIYRRKFEGEPWYLYSRCVVVDGILFCCWQGLMEPEGEYYNGK